MATTEFDPIFSNLYYITGEEERYLLTFLPPVNFGINTTEIRKEQGKRIKAEIKRQTAAEKKRGIIDKKRKKEITMIRILILKQEKLIKKQQKALKKLIK